MSETDSPNTSGPAFDGVRKARKRKVAAVHSSADTVAASSQGLPPEPKPPEPGSTQTDEMELAVIEEPAEAPATESKKVTPTAKPHRKWWRKRWFLIGAPILVIVVSTGAYASWYMWFRHKPAPVATVMKPAPTPTPTPSAAPIYDPLTGVATTAANAASPIIGVMIENLYPNARPQSGLGAAGLVYEALAEGGITRFLALFQEPLPPTIGPVRSLRPYFLDWGLEHDVPIAHAGGSQPALAEIKPLGLEDINALEYDGSYFYRTTDRVAPHNLYTNASLLTALDQKLGFATAPAFTPLPYKSDSPSPNPTHTDIQINYSYGAYNDEYKYDSTTDSYARFMGGTAHIDRNTGQQIYVKNVVVQFVNTSYGTQDDGDPMTIMQLVGSGTALVFEDGTVINGTWSKASDSAQTIFKDASGNLISFNRGNTWISVVPTGNTVNY